MSGSPNSNEEHPTLCDNLVNLHKAASSCNSRLLTLPLLRMGRCPPPEVLGAADAAAVVAFSVLQERPGLEGGQVGVEHRGTDADGTICDRGREVG